MAAPLFHWILLVMLSCTVCWEQEYEDTREEGIVLESYKMSKILEQNSIEVFVDLHQFRQPDDCDEQYHFASSNDTVSCTRKCIRGENRICYYKMVLENYAVLSAGCGNCTTNPDDCYLPQCVTADGFERGILTANRRLPGPSIQVCEGDRIVVDVHNIMLAQTSSIHWHGLIQMNSVYMDGVPFITQCPISEGTAHRYDFIADTVGTHYWHSHSGLLKLNGLQGSLIVRAPEKEDPVSNLYDYDLPAHVIIIQDWFHTAAESHMPGYVHHHTSHDTTFYLINGKGTYSTDGGKTNTPTPYHLFHVKKGFRYRFRVISAVCTHCPARFLIEGHKLLIIATDGSPVKPALVDTLEIYSGERYDFILDASKKVRSYWMQVRGMLYCFAKDVFQLAVLNYEGSVKQVPLTPKPTLDTFSLKGLVLNPQNATCGPKDNAMCITDLLSMKPIPEEIFAPEPDENIEYTFGFHLATVEEEFYSGKYRKYIQPSPRSIVIPWMNHIQMRKPPSPLVSQFGDIPEHIFCQNGTNGMSVCPNGENEPCSCVPIKYIRKGAMVQVVLIDKSLVSKLNHPFHLHGHRFSLISMGYLPEHLMNAEDINQLLKHRRLKVTNAPLYKDTFMIPARGYAVLRFIADNPGYWYLHCHFVFHHMSGMGTVIQVGTRSEFPSLPKKYPRCGDYSPAVVLEV